MRDDGMMTVRHHHPRIEFSSPNPIIVVAACVMIVLVVLGGLGAARTTNVVVCPKGATPAENLNEFRRWRRRCGRGSGDLGQAKVGQPGSQ